MDFVIEQDCTAGRLKHYSALCVVDAQVSEVATAAIGAWVKSGGIVVATVSDAWLVWPGIIGWMRGS